jgi:hydrophobe/amphiphile efflux-1 (HAE1) family protein
MNVSYPFIRRPIGTTLVAIGLFLVGAVAYRFLPVASVPAVELPTISVSVNRPGADPETMAATIAAPLERRLGEIAGVTELTSRSSLGSTRITIQFDLSRNIDSAARDVQAALNAALTDLPGDLPNLPTFRKFNPAAAPVMILALTSRTIAPSAMYDIADSVLAQRISQVEGVGDVTVSGAEQPAIRVRVDPAALSNAGISMEQVRTAIANANSLGPTGALDGATQSSTLTTNDQLRQPRDYGSLVVKTIGNGDVVRLSNIATVAGGVRNSRSISWFDEKPSVLLIITKDSDANVIETVQRIRDLLPDLKRWIPADVEISVLSDRSQTIKSGVAHLQSALLVTVALVMLVVFVFLRRMAATVAAGVTVPLSLAGTCAAMWAVGFSLNNVSLLALVVSVGFVVDDAIVMIENTFRNLERGMSPLRAALAGAQQIGFTIISISVSLIAAFIPLLFMGGITGRFFREFSVTLAFAIAISTAVSLSLTPMICAHFVRSAPSGTATMFDRTVEAVLSRMVRGYLWSLNVVLQYRWLVMIVFLAVVALTVRLYVTTPKGGFPEDDTGFLQGSTRASPDISFEAITELQQKAMAIVAADPAVAHVGSSIGSSGYFASVNRGTLFISLKPLAERGVSAKAVADRLRPQFNIPGLQVFVWATQDLHSGARSSDARNQYTMWSPNITELNQWVRTAHNKIKTLPEVTSVNMDRDDAGLQANVVIDRMAASRLGVRIQDINAALNNAFSQRQISTIYDQRNQYRVVLEIDPRFQRDPTDLARIYVPGSNNTQIPLSSLARFERGLSPLVVNHQGQFPAVTISFEPAPGVTKDEAANAVERAVAELHLPDVVRGEFAGDVRESRRGSATQPILLLAALFAVYIVLGVLYESLIHPLTIISTLPPAGLGALLALQLFGAELSLIAFIGIILLIGLVKKNGIMLVDFALDGERKRGLTPERAVLEACAARFRPILMTTLAALLGALPLVVATGQGSELRRPLGFTIIGGLLVSQFLTLYTTPVIYLMLDRLRQRRLRRRSQIPPDAIPVLPH